MLMGHELLEQNMLTAFPFQLRKLRSRTGGRTAGEKFWSHDRWGNRGMRVIKGPFGASETSHSRRERVLSWTEWLKFCLEAGSGKWLIAMECGNGYWPLETGRREGHRFLPVEPRVSLWVTFQPHYYLAKSQQTVLRVCQVGLTTWTYLLGRPQETRVGGDSLGGVAPSLGDAGLRFILVVSRSPCVHPGIAAESS